MWLHTGISCKHILVMSMKMFPLTLNCNEAYAEYFYLWMSWNILYLSNCIFICFKSIKIVFRGSFCDNSQTLVKCIFFSGNFLGHSTYSMTFHFLFITLRKNLLFFQMNTCQKDKLVAENIRRPSEVKKRKA